MIIDTKHAPKAIGPYVQAVSAGNLLFISGCCPFKPEDGTVNGDTIEKQTRQAMDNLKAIIESAGIGMDNIVKTTCFIRIIARLAINDIDCILKSSIIRNRKNLAYLCIISRLNLFRNRNLTG